MNIKANSYILIKSFISSWDVNANIESKGQGCNVLTRYATNILRYNHIHHTKKTHLAHFGSACEILDSEIKKGMSMFIIVAAESSEKLTLPFLKPKSSCSLVA